MAEFYRATKVEELGVKHPGLIEFIEEQYALRTTHTQIAAMLLELYGEEISVPALSNHYRLRIWSEQEADKLSLRDARNKTRILLEEMKTDPECDSAKMIEVFAMLGIVNQKERLAESDPLALMAELRRSRESVANTEIERGRLQLQLQESGIKNRDLELRIQQFERQREREKDAVKEAAKDGQKDPQATIDKILGIYGLSTAAAGPDGGPGRAAGPDSGPGRAAGPDSGPCATGTRPIAAVPEVVG